jgi:hypothetical protein
MPGEDSHSVLTQNNCQALQWCAKPTTNPAGQLTAGSSADQIVQLVQTASVVQVAWPRVKAGTSWLWGWWTVLGVAGSRQE